jgi:hypothetical protein
MQPNRLCTTAISSKAPTLSLWNMTASEIGAAIMVIKKTTIAGNNDASSHHDGMPNRIRPGPKMHAKMAPTVGQHDADHELVELGLAAVEHRLCDEENPDVEDDQPGEEHHKSGPVSRWIDASVDYRTSSALGRIDHRCPSALRGVNTQTDLEINHGTVVRRNHCTSRAPAGADVSVVV